MTFQLVELKNGETFNGHLVNCDNYMNITLREVYQTNSDGDKFWKLKECYIRGSTVCHFVIFVDQIVRESLWRRWMIIASHVVWLFRTKIEKFFS